MRLDKLKKLIEVGAYRDVLLEELENIKNDNFGGNWTLDDIIVLYKDNGKECSREKAREIADIAEKHHDTNIGINWDYLNCIIDNHEASIINEN